MNEHTHLDLFSGIGGFALAANWAGFRTVAMCEKDERCRKFIESNWGIEAHEDINTFYGRRYSGVSLVTGGPPCQPASRAGKQGGEGDDRWLWPQALRVLEETLADSFLFENPPGILDVGIDGILSEMGRLGYETQCFDIPACAVDSPQLRHRIWIVGFASGELAQRNRERRIVADASSEIEGETWQRERCRNAIGDSVENSSLADTRRERSGQDEQEWRPDQRTADRRDSANDVADSESDGSWTGLCESRPQFDGDGIASSSWANSLWVPCADNKLRRAPDDSFRLVDGLHRSILGALGNSIVPQVAYQILKAIKAELSGSITNDT